MIFNNMGLKQIFYYATVVICLLLGFYVEVCISKIACNKCIEGKSDNKIKMDQVKPTTAATITTGTIEYDTTGSTLNLTPIEEKLQICSTTAKNSKDMQFPYSSLAPEASTTQLYQRITTSSNAVTTTTATTLQEDTSCTCGIFLSSQFVKGSPKPPIGEPVISNSLDRTFPCNPMGQKQCQTKCLEQIVQHLPNAANILCASLDKDIHKERAYLFVKNCSNQWYNTNLAAGRAYCCKNGKAYKC